MSEKPDGHRPEQTLCDSNLKVPVTSPPIMLPSSPAESKAVAGNPEHTLDYPTSGAPVTRPHSRKPDDAPNSTPATAASMTGWLGRYEIHGEIGRGGMGAVLRGRDPTLGRELAIKILLAGRLDDQDSRRRFFEEAQIGGQLQHPGLVPVYELGTDAENRPFFAMKLVDGQTLSALLRARPTPADDLPRFLTIFEQICQAVGYAHARGVIHRDLKPANIMVGAFGEVQVMDWGLAKILDARHTRINGRPSPVAGANAVNIDTIRPETGGSESRDGSAMGTPAYMPPEQARGEIDRLDRRSDVFGLGAILCEILTGQPPFTDRSVTEILGRSSKGDLADTYTRLENCGGDAELVDLAKKCLAAERDDRPEDAGVVAKLVAAHRAGVEERLRTAEIERARAEARTIEERRRRRVQMALAIVVLLLVGLAAGGAWWLRKQRYERLEHDAILAQERFEREANLVRQTEGDLARVDLASQAMKYQEAWQILGQAEARLAAGAPPDELRAQVKQKRDELEPLRRDQLMVSRLEEARMHRAGNGKDGYDYEGSYQLYRSAFSEYGIDLTNSPVDQAAQAIAASRIHENLIMALDDWCALLSAHDDVSESRLRDIADLADATVWRHDLRVAFRLKKWEAVRDLADVVRIEDQPAQSLVFLGDVLQQAGQRGRALEVFKKGQKMHPNDFWLNIRLARAYWTDDPPKPLEAERYYTAALALSSDSPVVHNNLGLMMSNQKRLPEAEAEFREALRIRPNFALAHTNLGNLLHELKRDKEAEAEYHKALEIKKDFPLGYRNLANFLRDLGRLDDAETVLKDGVKACPQDPEAYFYLAYFLGQQKKLDGAEEAYRDVIRIKPDNAAAHNNLGNLLVRKEKDEDAVKEYREALRIKPDYALTYNHLGDFYRDRKKYAESETAYREAIRCRPDFTIAHNGLCELLRRQGKWAEAETACREAVLARPNDAALHDKLGLVLQTRDNLPEAEEAFRKATMLNQDDLNARMGLGNVYVLRNKLPEAEATFRQLIEHRPDNFIAHYRLGDVLAKRNQLAEAEIEFRMAIQLKPDYVEAHMEMGNLLRVRTMLPEAEAEYREVIRLNPRHALAYGRLGDTLRRQGRFADSLEAYKRCKELSVRDKSLQEQSVHWVSEAQHMVALDKRVPGLLSGKDKPVGSESIYEVSQLFFNKRYYAASVRFGAEAFAANAALENDLKRSARYNVACAAILAGCGQAEDPAPPDEKERARLRGLALGWLRADLTAYAASLETDPAANRLLVQKMMRYWMQTADLAPVRGSGAFAWLPAGEREGWRSFWVDVEALLKRTEEGK